MKDIDDKTIENALWNIRLTRKFKPLFTFCGIAQLVIVGIFVKVLWPHILNVSPEDSSAKMAVFFTIATLLVFLHFTCGVSSLYMWYLLSYFGVEQKL